MSIAEESLRLSGLFEAELLVELMLRYWKHPLADNAAYRAEILEGAAQTLAAAIDGQRLFDKLAPEDVNLVAAVWYAEWNALTVDPTFPPAELDARRKWADAVRHSLPSCFCDPDLLE